MVQRLVGQEDQRKEQRTTSDRSKRLLGSLGLRILGGAKKRGSDSCAAEMSMVRSSGEINLRIRIARCHTCVTVNEARCGHAGSK